MRRAVDNLWGICRHMEYNVGKHKIFHFDICNSKVEYQLNGYKLLQKDVGSQGTYNASTRSILRRCFS